MARHAEGWRLVPNQTSGIYHVRFRHEGQRYKFSTGARDPDEAASKAAAIYAEVVSGRRETVEVVRSSALALDVLAAKWLAAISTEIDPETLRTYRQYFRGKFLDYFASLDRITEGSWRDYARMRLRHVLRTTVGKELNAMRHFLRWCHEEGHRSSPVHLEAPPARAHGTAWKGNRRKREYIVFSEAEIEAIIAELPEWSRTHPNGWIWRPFPVKARFEVAWETALRPATLDALRAPGDYRAGAEKLGIRDEADKARFGRQLPLTDRAREALDRVCPEAGLIFGEHATYVDYLRRAAAKALAKGDPRAARISPYDFRHSRLTHLGRTTSNLIGMMFLAGHRKATTTSRYMRPQADAVLDVYADAEAAKRRKR